MKPLTKYQKFKAMDHLIASKNLNVQKLHMSSIRSDILTLDESLFIWDTELNHYALDVAEINKTLDSAPLDDWKRWDYHR